MRTLVFGGSFDPPHAGHAALLAAAARALDPDSIVIVPAWRNPLKRRAPAGPADRLAMAKAGLLDALPPRWRARAWIHTAELSSGRPIYTVDTLARLSADAPKAELHFVVGHDAAAEFGRWKDPRRLRRLARWWTARRPGAGGRIPSFFSMLRSPMPAASSSEIRARLAVGDDVSDCLPAAVRRHIERRGLYGLGRLRTLRGLLGARRYEHSRHVARLAGRLARRWGLDEDQALSAGILHDCGRSVPATRMGRCARARKLKLSRREQTARLAPLLLHAYLSEDVCRRRFGVSDPAVLSAVRKHTLGDSRMSRLDRLLYVADSCSLDRSYP
ncbi:MAG: bis(5'-nucleosyl)-tetraphosphatase (symmetrical) YqeK, partial [Elusimicrobia bacterium]|nr:bis(5'-nucleosyl)-tetraphosphatase (symmetrical) YqeK [Elusimicrobiota bacterium]